MTSPGATASTTAAHPRWTRVALVGVIAGFTSGLFGVGGGIVIVPTLVLLAGFPHKLATGTSLSAIIPISISAIVGYATAGEIDWTVVGYVSAGAVVGTLVGTWLLVRISPPMLQIVFSIAMVLTAVKMLLDNAEGSGRGPMTVGPALALVFLGLASGVLAGLLGVGGGIMIVPALTLLFGMPHVVAKGTSLGVILPTAVIGTTLNRRSGLTALAPAAVVGVAGVASAFAASKLSLNLDPAVSQGLFAALLIVVAVRLGFTGFAGLRHDRRRAAHPRPRPVAELGEA